MRVRPLGWLVALALAACSSEPSDPGDGDLTGGAGSGGSAAGSGGVRPTGGSASPSGGTSGGSPAGGAATGGTAPGSGGTAGPASGGSKATGGAASGGGGAVGGGAAGQAGSAGAGAGGQPPSGGAGAGGAAAGAGGAGAPGGGTAGKAGAGGSGGGGGAASFSPCPADPMTPCAVLPLGDSITEGFGSSGGGYRVELFRRAIAGGKNITFVGSQQNGPNEVDGRPFPRKHEGRGGYTIDTDAGHNGISGQITTQALAGGAHIVLLMIGTNDINGNVDVNNAPMRLGKLIDDITMRAPNALLVVASIIPIANNQGANQKVMAYNGKLPELVSMRAAAGKHVVFLDNYAAFTANSNYASAWMGDNLHPNNAGYAELGKAFYGAIESALPAAQ